MASRLDIESSSEMNDHCRREADKYSAAERRVNEPLQETATRRQLNIRAIIGSNYSKTVIPWSRVISSLIGAYSLLGAGSTLVPGTHS